LGEFYVSMLTETNGLGFSDAAGAKFHSVPNLSQTQIDTQVRSLRAGGVLEHFDGVAIGVRSIGGRPRVVVTYDYATGAQAQRNAHVLASMLATSIEIDGTGTGLPMRKEWQMNDIAVHGHLVVATLTPNVTAAKTMLMPMELLEFNTRLTVWDDAASS
ncbi:MAG TPA: hypothetical protein VGI86_05730, partial [Acidimicrobiia bacterium]